MGDVRFDRVYERLKQAPDRSALLRSLPDEEALGALAGAAREPGGTDPYFVNILATEVANRLRRNATIVETAAEALLSTDAQGRITYANPAACHVLGYTLDELLGHPFHDLVHKRDPDAERDAWPELEPCAYLKTLRAGVPVRAEEHRFLRRNGSEVRVELSTAPIRRDGEPDGVVLAFADVTERVAQREALRASEARHRLLVQEVKHYAIFMLDPVGRIQTWNEGAERLKGYTAEEAIGLNFRAFYTSEARERGHPAEVLRLAAENGTYREEGWRVRKDGSRFWAHVTVTALHDENGNLVGFGKVTQDLTAQRQAEEALQEAYDQLDQALYHSPLPMLVFDAEGVVTLWNRAAEKTFGWSRDEVVGERLPIIPPEKEEEFQRELRALRRGRTIREVHTLHRRRDNTRIRVRVHLSPLMDEEGKLARVIGTVERE